MAGGSTFNVGDVDLVPVFKPVMTTIEQGLVVRALGQLSAPDLAALREVVGKSIG